MGIAGLADLFCSIVIVRVDFAEKTKKQVRQGWRRIHADKWAVCQAKLTLFRRPVSPARSISRNNATRSSHGFCGG
jgi:hypothetical protein